MKNWQFWLIMAALTFINADLEPEIGRLVLNVLGLVCCAAALIPERQADE